MNYCSPMSWSFRGYDDYFISSTSEPLWMKSRGDDVTFFREVEALPTHPPDTHISPLPRFPHHGQSGKSTPILLRPYKKNNNNNKTAQLPRQPSQQWMCSSRETQADLKIKHLRWLWKIVITHLPHTVFGEEIFWHRVNPKCFAKAPLLFRCHWCAVAVFQAQTVAVIQSGGGMLMTQWRKRAEQLPKQEDCEFSGTGKVKEDLDTPCHHTSVCRKAKLFPPYDQRGGTGSFIKCIAPRNAFWEAVGCKIGRAKYCHVRGGDKKQRILNQNIFGTDSTHFGVEKNRNVEIGCERSKLNEWMHVRWLARQRCP